MKETKAQKRDSGITLIALVITIIVMMILVGVTVSMAVNGGLFDQAGKAVGQTKNALNAEQELSNGRIKVGTVWYDSIGDYLKGIESDDQEEVVPTAITISGPNSVEIGREITLTVTPDKGEIAPEDIEWTIEYDDGPGTTPAEVSNGVVRGIDISCAYEATPVWVTATYKHNNSTISVTKEITVIPLLCPNCERRRKYWSSRI